MNRKEHFQILIVEDHAEMSVMLGKFLGTHGFEIVNAATGEKAIEIYEKQKPDLILMDIMLPGISGIEATKRIRKMNSSDNYIPILMLTAKNQVEDVVEGLDAGADDYIVKPFKFDELLARIKTAIRLKELNDRLKHQAAILEDANKKNNQLNQTLIGKNKELRKKIYDLHNIFDVSLELHSILDLNRLANSTLLSLIGQFSCKSALFLHNLRKNEQRLNVLNSKGIYKTEIENLKIEKSDVLFNYLEKNSDPFLLNKIPKALKNSKAIEELKNIEMEIISPVHIHKKEMALLCLGERVKNKKYTDNELEVLTTVSNIVSIAVSNAFLYDEVVQLSYTDGMTELHNYRYFEMRLNEEIIRHSRTKQEVSLIILDVDYFKNYNDTLGHPAGDEVLRQLALILKDTVRENDIVSRYGGEEFAVILPGNGIDGTSILAERLRANVENHHFPNEEIQPKGKLTISVGTATLPAHADDAKDLIHKADTALYSAKKSGRNRVVQFTS